MYKLKFRITALAPLVISKSKGNNNFVTTADFIPGNAVLGMFAAKFPLNDGKAHENNDFRTFFLGTDLCFTNAYIISKNERNEIINNSPVPLSVQSEKDNKENVFDLLFDEAEDGDGDKIPTKAFGEYGNIKNGTLSCTTAKKSLNFHHERDDITGSTKNSIIFNYESLNSKQEFEGFIYGKKETIEKFRSYFPAGFEARTGRSRNVQYGKVNFKFLGEPEGFNPGIKDPVTEGLYSLTLLSDLILLNGNGFSTTDIAVVEEYLHEKISAPVKIEKCFTKQDTVENYVSVWKLKRPSEASFKAGSCFLLSGITDTDKQNLQNLEKEGIGERKNEGYGRIVFNYQSDELTNVINAGDMETEIAKPAYPIPALTGESIKQIVRDIIVKQIKHEAVLSEGIFTENNKSDGIIKISKSLVSRLEAFVKKSNDKNEFNKMLKLLRKTAKDKLERLRMKDKDKHKDFLTWLKEHEVNTNSVLKNVKFAELQNILGEISYNAGADADFNNKLYKEYFLTFFASLRKSLKTNGG